MEKQHTNVTYRIKPSVIAAVVAQLCSVGMVNAASIEVGANCSLADAIRAANRDAAIGGSACAAGDGADVISLPTQTITLTQAVLDGEQYGPSAFPVVKSEITIQGNGSTIERSNAASTPQFRIFAAGGENPSAGGENPQYDGSVALNLQSLTLSNGALSDDGAAIHAVNLGSFSSVSLQLEDVYLLGNHATGGGRGGAVYASTLTALEIDNSTISENRSSERGGGVFVQYSSVVISNTTVHQNTTGVRTDGSVFNTARGGGVYLHSTTADIQESAITNNFAAQGGGLYSRTSLGNELTFSALTLNNNHASGAGGGMFIRNPYGVVLDQSTVAENTAGIHAGGIRLHGVLGAAPSNKMRITNSSIVNNQLTGIMPAGFDVSAYSLASSGAAIYSRGAELNIANSTISGNSHAATGAAGIQLFAQEATDTAHLSNTTIVQNQGGVGLAFSDAAPGFSVASNLQLYATVLAGHAAGDCNIAGIISGGLADSNDNWFEDSSCIGGAAAEILDGEPGLRPLADNGGSTLTHAPSSNSPLVNTGELEQLAQSANSVCRVEPVNALDQRGAARDQQCDIGAVEFIENDNLIEDEDFIVIPLPNKRAVVVPL